MTTSEKLASFGIRPSIQRVMIYEYLLTHRTHPTVEEIYEALSPKLSTLSKTTIYNTVALFEEKGAALILNIDEKKQHFDGYTHAHAHFLCRQCRRVYDLPYPKMTMEEMPEGFVITQTDVSYKGCCPECNSNREVKDTQL